MWSICLIFIQSTQLSIPKMWLFLEKFIRYFKSIVSFSNMRVDPMVSETHPYMKGKEYTSGLLNNHPVLSAWFQQIELIYLGAILFFIFLVSLSTRTQSTTQDWLWYLKLNRGKYKKLK